MPRWTLVFVIMFVLATVPLYQLHSASPATVKTGDGIVAPEDVYLSYAIQAAKWINHTMQDVGGGYWIPISNSTNTTSSSYLTGMSGIAQFLADLYRVTGNSSYRDLLLHVISELDAIKATNGTDLVVYGWGDKLYNDAYTKYNYGSIAVFEVRPMYRSFDGSIGVGMMLLDLFERTQNYTYLRLALGIGNDIATEGYVPEQDATQQWPMISEKYALHTRPDNEQDYVWYDYLRGVGGIGEFMLRLYTMTHNESFFHVAYSIANGLIKHASVDASTGGYYWITGYTLSRTSTSQDITPMTDVTSRYYGLTGQAGILKFMIDMFDYTGNTTYLTVAKKIAQHLISKQLAGAWPDTFALSELRYYTGYIYGAAGIADVLLDLYLRTGNQTILTSVKAAADFLLLNGENVSTFGNATRWPIRFSWTGTRFSVDLNPGYTDNIGYGTAGVGVFFAKLYKHTGNATYLAAARRAANYLIQTAIKNENGCYWKTLWKGVKEASFIEDYWTGYYSGVAGIADFLLQVHALLSDAKESAIAGADALVSNQNADGSWTTGDTSDIYLGIREGVAGMGLVLLEAYSRTGNSTYLDSVKKAAEFIISHGVVVGNEVSWPMTTTSTNHYAGWDYGAAGIAYFLYRAFLATGNSTYRNYVIGAVRWLSSHYRGDDTEHYWMEYYTNGDNSSASSSAYYGISKGTAGVVLLLATIAPHLLNESLLTSNAIWPELVFRNYSYYNMSYFSYEDESVLFKELKLASAWLVNHKILEPVGASWPLSTGDATKYTGYFHGAAGIGMTLIEAQCWQEYQAWKESLLSADLSWRIAGLAGLDWSATGDGISSADSTVYYGVEYGLAGKLLAYSRAWERSTGNATLQNYISTVAKKLIVGYSGGRFVLSESDNTAYNGFYNGSAGIVIALETACAITGNMSYHDYAIMTAKVLVSDESNGEWPLSNATGTVATTYSRGIAGIVHGLFNVYDLYAPVAENVTFNIYNESGGSVTHDLADVMYYSDVELRIDLRDNESGLFSVMVYYSVDGDIWSALSPANITGNTYTFVVANLSSSDWNKHYQFFVIAMDRAMRMTYSTTWSFTVGDNVLPEIDSITNVTDINSSTVFHVRVEAIDWGSGVASVVLYYWEASNPSDVHMAPMGYEYGHYYGADIPASWNVYGRTIYYLVSVVDAAGNTLNTTTLSYKVVDMIPPTIEHVELPPRIDVGVTTLVSIRVNDEGGSDVARVILSYKDPITQEWHNITMDNVGNNEWRAQLPPFETEFALSIKFYVIDGANNTYVSDIYSVAVTKPASPDLLPVIIAVAVIAGVAIGGYVVYMKRKEAIKQPPAPTPTYKPKYKPRVYKPRVVSEKTRKPPEKEIEELTKEAPAMAICPHCHAVIPANAEKCPKCGKPTYVSLK